MPGCYPYVTPQSTLKESFTVRWLHSLERKEPPPTRVEIPDASMPGLYIVRQPSGALSWAVRYRFEGRPRKLTLGSYPALGLSDARRLAGGALREVAEGRDPAAAKAAAKAEAPIHDRDLLEHIVEEYMRRVARPSLRSADQLQRIFERHVLPRWAGRKVQSITRRDVLELTDAIVDRGQLSAANRVFATVRPLFNWCVSRTILESSPCAGLQMPGTDNRRDRVLTAEEIRLLWAATDFSGGPFASLFRLLLLTGQRREEVASMRWSEIDGSDWTVSAARAKNGQPNLVPLSPQAITVIAARPRISHSDYVLTTSGAKPISGFSKAKERLDVCMLALAQSQDSSVELKPWRIHDLRRTAATGMARLRIPPHVIEAVLNHRSGQVSGVAAVYNRYDYLEEKRTALAVWGKHVAELVDTAEPYGAVVSEDRGPR